MEKCPYCQANEQQVKNGRNPSGSQRYKCRICGRIYTLEPTPAGYESATRDQAGIYAGVHHAMPDKSQTYSVEGDNAELRHYLARLARASRCFSRSIHALHNAVKLFVFAWNRRQLAIRRFPTYPAHLLSFVF